MPTGLAVAVLIFLVLGAATTAIVILRLLSRPGSPDPSSQGLSFQGPSLSSSPSEDDLSLRSTLAGRQQTHRDVPRRDVPRRDVPHRDVPRSAVPSGAVLSGETGRSAEPAWDPSKESEEDAPTTYDSHRESEDDVPTTLFRDEDSQELAEFIADYDRETKGR